MNSQKYYIKTFGCQANIADSHTIAGVLEALDFERLPELHDVKEDALLEYVIQNANVLVVNTCSVRQKSEDKVYGIGKIVKRVVDSGCPKPFIVMAGCMVGSVTGERQRYEFEELKRRTSWVDAYVSPAELFNLPILLQKHNVLSEWAVKKFNAATVTPVVNNPEQGFVNISYGCDNFCTFCVVPYARGAEVSRPEKDILREVEHLAKRGFAQITLCGQNVNSWGLGMREKFEVRTGSNQKLPFADLLRKVCSIPEVNKVGFISSNPFDFTTDLIEAIALPKVSNYLHIAVQSGNNEVLKRMNRRHTIEDFVELINKLKLARPDAEFGTDIIVGFPGETREQFMDTVKLFETIKFNVAFISMYSTRKGTPAQKFFEDDVPLEEKKWRHAYLTKVWENSLHDR